MLHIASPICLAIAPVVLAAETVVVFPGDCGPAAYGEFGAVFWVPDSEYGRRSYLARGNAFDVCPKLTSGNPISGYVQQIPEDDLNLEGRTKGKRFEFVVVSFGDEEDT